MFVAKKFLCSQNWNYLKIKSPTLNRYLNPVQFTSRSICFTEVNSHGSCVNLMQHTSFSNFNRPTLCASKYFSQNYSFAKIHMSCLSKKEMTSKEYEKLQNKGVTVIDVRDINEIKSTGTIPGSLNITIDKLNDALNQSDDDFKNKYRRNKPNKNESILFLCQRGVRSKIAVEEAEKLGYKKVMSLKGGWESFSKK